MMALNSDNGEYRSYQSIEVPHQNEEQLHHQSPANSVTQPRKHHFYLSRKSISLIGCITLLAVISIYAIANQEREIARSNNLYTSWWTVLEIRKAQIIADKSREKLLNNEYKSINDSSVNANVRKTLEGLFLRGNAKNESALNEAIRRTATTSAPEGCETTIVILRHCEKELIREHCAYVGYERSVYLTTLFGSGDERWPAPSLILALGPGNRRRSSTMNFREIETVGPLSEKVGVPVNDLFSIRQTKQLAETLFNLVRKGEMCGKVTVISWKHSNIGNLAHRLGCGPVQGCPFRYSPKTFDEAWQIKYVYRDFGHSPRKDLKLVRSPEWRVYGSVQKENFDPLAFSKNVGDYPPNPTSTIRQQPGWRAEAVEIAERKSPKDTDDWVQEGQVGFLASAQQRAGSLSDGSAFN